MTTQVPAPPERIGPYRIERLLGAGGMGQVFLGIHETTGRQAAVKMLPAQMAHEPGLVIRFSREIDAMRMVRGENVVEIYESGEWEGTYFYAMEYVAGETLAEKLYREKRIPWRTVIDYAVQICRALKSAHNSGIIHRDLKPSNLLIDEAGLIKLTDFGVAQVFAASKVTMTGGVIGTAEYMSPEQAQGKRVTKQSDIYSLGAVMYVMLTGRPPFTGKSALDIVQKHKFGRFDSPRRIVPDIPHWLDSLVCQCLAKEPKDRFPDAYVLSLRLQEIPKKVDLAHSGTIDVDGARGTEETAPAVGDFDHGPVGGTLMRDLIRGEIARQHEQSPLEKVFDNTWVLVLMLLMLIGSVSWWWSRRAPSPEKLFARGEELMAQPAGPAWDEARRDVFEPLMLEDPDTWEPKIEPYLRKLALYDFRKSFLGRRGAKGEKVPRTELERFLAQAMHHRQMGQTAKARRLLISLADVLRSQPDSEATVSMVDAMVEELDAQPEGQGFEVMSQTLARIAELRKAGKTVEADRLEASLRELYRDDDEARRRLPDSTAQNSPRPSPAATKPASGEPDSQPAQAESEPSTPESSSGAPGAAPEKE